MRKIIAAGIAAAVFAQSAVPALANDMFNPTTMLGWHRKTDTSVMAYMRVPLGPPNFKDRPSRAGIAIVGPRGYSAGESAMRMQGPKLVDFSITSRGLNFNESSVRTFSIGPGVAWTSDPRTVPPGRSLNLFESGLSWALVGAAAVAIGVGAYAFIESDKN